LLTNGAINAEAKTKAAISTGVAEIVLKTKKATY